MGLQFILGNSGNGKTHYLHMEIIKSAAAAKNKHFLVIVPEQCTMQTQRELVGMHEGHSLLNIDVLSFNRLAYRVFDEFGGIRHPVLEETGKSLILRKIAEEKSASFTVLRKNIAKMGCIGEMKSLISELAQYNISPAQLSLAVQKLPKGSFSCKLGDVLTMYQGFLEFLKGRFITAEEVLGLLADVADKSQLLSGSVIAFDGFTGFTPVQNILLRKLLPLAQDVLVTVAIDTRENPFHCTGSHELFAMSKKMIRSLQNMAEELRVPVKTPIRLEGGEKSRFSGAPSLRFLEQNLFRGKKNRFALGEKAEIAILGLQNPREELRYAAREIERLVRRHRYRYRDIAVVCGDLPQYANYAAEVFAEYRIPLFLDRKTTVIFHPFTEFLRSALEIIISDFSHESVFRYLRSGLSGISREETDILENYCLAAGVRGHKKWSGTFCYAPKGYEDGELEKINEIRAGLWAQFALLWDDLKAKDKTVCEQTDALYRFLCARNAQQQLKQRQLLCESAGDLKGAKEYAQIYRIVMDLFDKMADLLGTEALPLKEYARILDSGLEEAKAGILPTGYDRVVCGDIERTRLDEIRVLFFVGVNDGIIPKAGGTDGLLSQLERERLAGMQIELAPAMREKIFIQKFYLYLALTKPSEKLYLSYARVDGGGKAIRPSYLIHAIENLYENLPVRQIDAEAFSDRVVTPESARNLLIEGMERAPDWTRGGKETEIRCWAALARWYERQEEWRQEIMELLQAAQFSHQDMPISPAVAKLLYGTVLENSVTRLETFAACAFSHFLSYGLFLQERAESSFSAVDFGNVFHEALERFSLLMQERGESWFSITKEAGEEILLEALEQALGAGHHPALYENARSFYAKKRICRILMRTIETLFYQIRQGRFTPESFEVSFSRAKDLKSVNFNLSEDEKMHLRGRIDRIDTYQHEDRLYVKVIDYKSGNTDFQFLNIYYGLQLQLVVYMNAALELMQKRYPQKEAVWGGMFYYHLKDPMVEAENCISDEELREKIFSELRLDGLANDDREALAGLDRALSGGQGASSRIIPAAFNQDGSIRKSSKTASADGFAALSSHVNQTILRLGQRMMKGDVSISPYQLSGRTGCDYCGYRAVCQFDTRLPGFYYRSLEELSAEDLQEKMKGADEA